MPKIKLFSGRKHVQIEFPDSVPHPKGRRGGRGTSLHLQHGKVRDVTVEELDYICRARPEVYECLRVLPDPVVPGRTRRKLAAARDASDTAQKDELVAKGLLAEPAKAQPAPEPSKPSKRKRGKKPS